MDRAHFQRKGQVPFVYRPGQRQREDGPSFMGTTGAVQPMGHLDLQGDLPLDVPTALPTAVTLAALGAITSIRL